MRVVRGGKERTISTYDLLVGDVLLIDTGDILPADGLLFESSNLRCGPGRLASLREPRLGSPSGHTSDVALRPPRLACLFSWASACSPERM